MKAPKNCTEVRHFSGLKDEIADLINDKYWGKKFEEIDSSLAPFKERLVWGTILIFKAPPYKVGAARSISCTARTERNFFLASSGHDFVLYSHCGPRRGSRQTDVLIRGYRMKLTDWLGKTAEARSGLWKARRMKWTPKT